MHSVGQKLTVSQLSLLHVATTTNNQREKKTKNKKND